METGENNSKLFIKEKDFWLGILEQIAGLLTPSIIPRISRERIISAAVLPADTKPDSEFSFTNKSPW